MTFYEHEGVPSFSFISHRELIFVEFSLAMTLSTVTPSWLWKVTCFPLQNLCLPLTPQKTTPCDCLYISHWEKEYAVAYLSHIAIFSSDLSRYL